MVDDEYAGGFACWRILMMEDDSAGGSACWMMILR